MADDKSRYVASYGLAPHFIKQLADSVRENDYVLLFSEALNKKAQQKQPDVQGGPKKTGLFFESLRLPYMLT